jgi:predicted metal-dependent enzyme (double-stranded beta helix superfamily)
MHTEIAVVEPLIERLRNAVRLGDTTAIANRIKSDLESFIPAEGLILPDRFRQPKSDSYARRLLYRDEELGFNAIVMTWGPGQRTALHDHAGIWCVEGVLEGVMEVTRWDLQDMDEDICRFVEKGTVQARAGSAGALIPPYEYHVLGNARREPSLTLHVYGGEMTSCNIFEPLGDGLFRRSSRSLKFDD